MEWFARDFDHPLYFEIYQDKEQEAAREGAVLAELLDLPPDSLVLDLPCGWGRLHSALRARGWRVIGGDLSTLNLRRHQQEHPGLLARLDFRALPFRNASADGIFCAFTSWGYFQSEAENQRQLQEFARVLKPHGTLLLDLVGREALRAAIAPIENQWMEIGPYRERVRWTPDQRRVLTDRIMDGVRFRHDIWIPENREILDHLAQAGFGWIDRFDDNGSAWRPEATRWVYRAIRI